MFSRSLDTRRNVVFHQCAPAGGLEAQIASQMFQLAEESPLGIEYVPE